MIRCKAGEFVPAKAWDLIRFIFIVIISDSISFMIDQDSDYEQHKEYSS